MSETGVVYTLVDPRTDEPRYVGATVEPDSRLAVIVSRPHNDELKGWIEDLDEDGLSPDMTILRVAHVDELGEVEKEVLEDMAEEYDVLNSDLDPSYRNSDRNHSRPKLRDRTVRVLEKIKEEHGYSSIDEAVTHVLREAGYDV